jgi:hypothetical protein
MTRWCDGHGLVLNPVKTGLVQFTVTDTNYSIYVPRQESVKFLGLNVDSQLKWKKHCMAVSKKLCSAVYAVKNLRSTGSITSLRSFYFACVDARLRYGIVFWGSSAHAGHLFILQKLIVRHIVGAPAPATCRLLFRRLNIMPLASLYMYEILMFYKKYEDSFVKNIFNSMTTRACNDLSVPQQRTRFFEIGPRYKAISCYNALPADVATAVTLRAFKTKLKVYLLDKQFYTLDEMPTVH